MDNTFELLYHGFLTAISGWNLLYCLIGVSVGMLIGVLPGIGPAPGTALLIPITFYLEPVSAIIMLSGIFYGAMYGGTITSVLINLPGEAASVITCIDGYQMAKQGRAGAALGVAAIGSFVGGTVAVLGLALIGPPLANFALKFGPPEFFAVMIMALLLLLGLMGKSLAKGFLGAALGMLLSMVGMDQVTGANRFTFNQMNLLDGFDFVTVAMGLFGISEILLSLGDEQNSEVITKIDKMLPEREEWKSTIGAIGRGTGIGFLSGLIPGVNAVVASLISYTVEKKLSKDPSRFGKGAIEGVAGPETANNAFAGAALIPLFTLGLPTSAVVAILMGAFIMHGLQPGPTLFAKNPEFVWAVIASMFVGNLLLLAYNMPLVKLWAKLARVPTKLLFPLILIISMTGVYCVNNNVMDICMMIGFGFLGFVLRKLDIPIAAMILTFILGRQIESSLVQSLSMSKTGFMIFFQRPISATLMIVSLIILVVSIISSVKKKRSMLADDLE